MGTLPRKRRTGRRGGERGQSVIEATLMAPWIFVLFMGILDVGMYAYALTSVENAIRIGTHFGSLSEDSSRKATAPCNAIVSEMRPLANVTTLNCAGQCQPNLGGGETCNLGSLVITTIPVTAAASADGEAPAVKLTVRYQTIPIFVIPGLPGQLTFTRVADMRVRGVS